MYVKLIYIISLIYSYMCNLYEKDVIKINMKSLQLKKEGLYFIDVFFKIPCFIHYQIEILSCKNIKS